METPGLQPYNFEPEFSDCEFHDFEPDLSDEYIDTSTESEGDDSIHSFDSEENHAELEGSDNWCSCGKCSAMASQVECICCQKCDFLQSRPELEPNSCITEHVDFKVVCLHPAVLGTAFIRQELNRKRRHTDTVESETLSNKQYRLAAYRQFIAWGHSWQRLGQGVRKVVPSCVVTAIRNKYPKGDGEDCIGFKEK
ncbi:P2X purinoceptor 7-like [Ptychodera flava]|uniref:P2X purinoceptor 7-like n=1 Tax=Ptychodera flava TaxID=63121 RepID=UPI00396A209D